MIITMFPIIRIFAKGERKNSTGFKRNSTDNGGWHLLMRTKASEYKVAWLEKELK